ncbi:hypothetical protein HAX54_024557 [Datura stramonium]|uniref:Uncharacterized protein n=1 Tax=Datura stramonium TaxID=4076 RepID=A0ABS8UZG5_DATST|nr:hypothetical protein [Datura stramonium]
MDQCSRKAVSTPPGLGDCKAPKVLGDIVESIAGAIFLDSGCNTKAVWKVFNHYLHPMVTPETLPMHPVENCKSVGMAQNPQKKMAQKLAARNALVVLKEREEAEAKKAADDGKKKKKSQTRMCARGGQAHAKRFTYGVRVNTSDKGFTDECIREPMQCKKKAKDSAAALLLELLNKWYS